MDYLVNWKMDVGNKPVAVCCSKLVTKKVWFFLDDSSNLKKVEAIPLNELCHFSGGSIEIYKYI